MKTMANEVELSNGGIMRWNEEDGMILLIDRDGNPFNVWRPGEEGYEGMKNDYFPNHTTDVSLYHTLFVEVEFDRSYFGGDYEGVGEKVLVPVALVDAVGIKKAFQVVTGLWCKHIVHFSSDELVDAKGELVDDWKKFGE